MYKSVSCQRAANTLTFSILSRGLLAPIPLGIAADAGNYASNYRRIKLIQNQRQTNSQNPQTPIHPENHPRDFHSSSKPTTTNMSMPDFSLTYFKVIHITQNLCYTNNYVFRFFTTFHSIQVFTTRSRFYRVASLFF